MGRITRVSHSYYETPRRSTPTVVESRSTRQTEFDDQPYIRELEAGPNWVKVDYQGWLSEVGLVCLVNNERLPKEGEAVRVLEVILKRGADFVEPYNLTHPPHLYLFPRESFQANLDHSVKVFVRSQDGSVLPFIVTSFPK